MVVRIYFPHYLLKLNNKKKINALKQPILVSIAVIELKFNL